MFSIILIRSRSSPSAHETCFRFLLSADFVASELVGLAVSEESRLMYSRTEKVDVDGFAACGFGGGGLTVSLTAPPAVMPIDCVGVVDLN